MGVGGLGCGGVGKGRLVHLLTIGRVAGVCAHTIRRGSDLAPCREIVVCCGLVLCSVDPATAGSIGQQQMLSSSSSCV